MRDILQKDGELQETVQLVGKDALPERERLTLEIGTMVKQFYLQQNAFHPVDQYSSPEKTYHILETILDWADEAYDVLEDGAVVEDIISLSSKNQISQMATSEDFLEVKEEIKNQMNEEFEELR
ncbi:V-type ATP synthase subunit A [Candidatus Haloredivivus sp. G17]|nr:V-type ATP synthase subunit A [Candidatus Haloredivivus sp. G17]